MDNYKYTNTNIHKYTNTRKKYTTPTSSLVVDEEVASLAFVKMCKWSDRNLFIKQSSPTPDSVLRSLRILKIHHLLYFKISEMAKFIMGLSKLDFTNIEVCKNPKIYNGPSNIQNLTSLTLRCARTP